MNEQNALTITILGRNYSIVTDEDHETVTKAAQLVDMHLKKSVNASTSPKDAIKKTTFVALQIAVDLIKKNQELTTVYAKTDTLNEMLKDTATP